MKKSIICMLLSLLLVFTAMPVTVSADESDTAAIGETLTVNVTIDQNKCVVVTWNDVPGAASYYLVLTNFNAKYGKFMQVRTGQTVSALEPCKYTFYRNYSLDEAYGSPDYKVSVYAQKSNGDTIVSAESDVFQIGIESLATPTVTLYEDGYASWSSVPHAEEYTVALYQSNGNIVKKLNLTSNYTSYDFSSYMIGGNKYYILLFATSIIEPYRQSKTVTSSVVTYTDDAKSIDGLQWNNNILSWTAYPKATIYGLWLYKLSDGSYIQQGSAVTATSPTYDFSSLFSQYGTGTYKVKVQARSSSTQIISLDTDSPAVAFSNSFIITNFTISGITEPVAGESPDGECLIPANCGYRPTIPNYGYISWYDDDGNLLNPDTDRFKAGEKYSAQVTLIPTEGYEFAESGLTGTMNGKDTTKSIWVSTPKKKITMSRRFTCVASADDLSGTVTSFLNSTDETTISFRNITTGETGVVRVTGNSTTYSIPNLPGGRYVFYVAKPNHVNRTYTLVVGSAAQTLDYKIHPIGDINGDGKITTVDYGKANSHARGKSTLSGYEFSCADVNADSKVSTADAGRINAHAKGKSKLW